MVIYLTSIGICVDYLMAMCACTINNFIALYTTMRVAVAPEHFRSWRFNMLNLTYLPQLFVNLLSKNKYRGNVGIDENVLFRNQYCVQPGTFKIEMVF